MDGESFHQRTFKQRASYEGVGLHTGERVRLTLAPAPADSGISQTQNLFGNIIDLPAERCSLRRRRRTRQSLNCKL